VVVLVNAADAPVTLFVIVDALLHAIGTRFTVAFSNRAQPKTPDPVVELGQDQSLAIHEVDGNVSRGPARVLRVMLQSREAQILTQAA
jgi:hypothetical protein